MIDPQSRHPQPGAVHALSVHLGTLLAKYGLPCPEGMSRLYARLDESDRSAIADLMTAAWREQGGSDGPYVRTIPAVVTQAYQDAQAAATSAATPPDDAIVPFTPEQITPRLRFVRWLVQTGRLSEQIA